MTCAACAARIEKVLGRVPGVERATVNLALDGLDVPGLDARMVRTGRYKYIVYAAGEAAVEGGGSDAVVAGSAHRLVADRRELPALLDGLAAGDRVHVEADVIGKYVQRLAAGSLAAAATHDHL